MDIKIADPYKSYTKRMEKYIILLSQSMCIKSIATYLDLDWGAVKDIIKNNLVKEYKKPDLRNITMISIDEISVKKGHVYLRSYLCWRRKKG
jgi:hypothetical protein